MLVGVIEEPSRAKYNDDCTRKWQGEKLFRFRPILGPGEPTTENYDAQADMEKLKEESLLLRELLTCFYEDAGLNWSYVEGNRVGQCRTPEFEKKLQAIKRETPEKY